jgi:hypothetical protein
MPKIAFKTPEELYTKAIEFFDICKKDKRPKTITGLCLHLWVRRDYISEKAKEDLFADTIKKIRNEIENDVEEWLMSGKYNATGAIFNLKNNFWRKDKQEIHQEIEGNLFDNITFNILNVKTNQKQLWEK